MRSNIGESFFFRDEKVFDFLKIFLRKKGGNINVISIGCARGEEPYSVAITADMIDMLERVNIVGLDIDGDFLRVAKEGIYDGWSLRSLKKSILAKYFSKTNGSFKIIERIKNSVVFFRGDIRYMGDIPEAVRNTKYDVVLCRNLIMYYDSLERKVILENIKKLMGEDAILIVAPQEIFLVDDKEFFSCGEKDVIYFKLGKEPKEPEKRILFLGFYPQKEEVETVENVRDLINRGDYGEAEVVLNRLIEENPIDNRLHFLKGILYLLQDKWDAAESSFKKAIFLDPKNYNAANFLSLIYERKGEEELAERYRKWVETTSSSGSKTQDL